VGMGVRVGAKVVGLFGSVVVHYRRRKGGLDGDSVLLM
jgi:hypothetical protein